MLSGAEIARGTSGALKILQGDATGPSHFDNSLEACLRSFRLMAVVAPLYGFYLLIYYNTVEVAAEEWEIAAIEAMRYVVDWLLFPVIFHEIARRRGWVDRYPRYISALNWINLPALVVAIVGLIVARLVPSIAVVVDLALHGLSFYWFLVTARMMLGVTWPLAVMLLAINWVPSLFLSLIVARLLGVGPMAGG